jgi:hypothetical protein
VHGFAAEPRFEQRLTPSVSLRIRYRFYTQTAADFYQPIYYDSEITVDSLKSADVRLRDFNNHTAGVMLRLMGDSIQDWSVAMSYDRYWETNHGVQANLYQVTLSIPY